MEQKIVTAQSSAANVEETFKVVKKILIQIKKKEKKKSFGDDTGYNSVYLSIISRLICDYSKETNKRKSL